MLAGTLTPSPRSVWPSVKDQAQAAKSSPRVGHGEVDAGAADRGVDLGARADDAGVGEQALDVGLAEAGDGCGVEAGEGGAHASRACAGW